ncbi:MAG: type VI secretion system tip protein TssI/VgrG, partial [Acidobacteriota bacterium]
MSKPTQEGRLMELFTPMGKDHLLIRKLEVTEGISQLFTMDLEVLVYEGPDGQRMKTTVATPDSILGKPVTIVLNQNPEANEFRHFSGIVSRVSQGTRVEQYSVYHLTVVPHVWLLTQKKQSRIFPDMSVTDILTKVFTGFTIKNNLSRTYKPRTFCVQYAETDWDFASRLMEEEGIFYYFVHEDGTDKLLLGDAPGHHNTTPNKSEFPYYVEVTGSEPEGNPILSFFTDHQLQTGKVTLWDYNFQLPTQNFSIEQPTRSSVPDQNKLESYVYPGGYAKKYDGIDKTGGEKSDDLQNIFSDRAKTAKDGMDSLDSMIVVSHGISRCSPFTAGHRFTLGKHPNKDLNKGYVLTTVRHTANQRPEYGSLPEDETRKTPYANDFECIPYGSEAPPFRPLQKTARPIIYGAQTATVVGPSGEEIFTDKYGRVKVQFHWDRSGQFDPSSSSWIRVAQGWAGNKWGIMFIPRVGMEVIVHFQDGDPDQPIITGCVYNPGTMPPYTLPDEKTKSTIKSNSSKGGGGFNEFRFEDKKGSEQIYIHGEKDQDIQIKNDNKQKIGNDQHLSVVADQKEKIGGDMHLHVVGDIKEKVDGSI